MEAETTCPYCGESFTVVVDCSEDRQSYIEDCSICCRPIQFTVECADGELVGLTSDRS